MGKRLEILSPAGSPEALKAAVQNGADSVYFGTTMFNARHSAANFDEESLFEAVRYCRQRGVLTYITLNTLIGDDELYEFEKQIRTVAKSGADAVIFQDFGAAEVAKAVCPSLSRHASTQMTVHSTEGAAFVKKQGFERVILSRELDLESIETISKNSGIEVEIFGHGALCMCYSGRCYMSALAGGRSGNRGRCAQPCRMEYELNGKGGNSCPLSLKDLSLAAHLKEIEDAGVACVKIEGRMKRPEYVALATRVFAKAVKSGQSPTDAEMSALVSVFSRSGFTDSYFTGQKGPHMFGVRTKNEDFSQYAKILREQSATYGEGREAPRVAVSGRFFATVGKPTEFEVSDRKNHALCLGEMPERAENIPSTEEAIKENLKKSGGTPFYFKEIEIDLEEGLRLKASEINKIRRDALSRLLEMRGELPKRELFDASAAIKTQSRRQKKASEDAKIYARFEKREQVPDDALSFCDMVFLPPHELENASFELNDKYGIALPSIIFDREREEILSLVKGLKERGVRTVLCENPAQIEMMKGLDLLIFGGAGLNIFNSLSAEVYKEAGLSSLTCSFELSGIRTSKINSPCDKAIVAYGRLPVMVCENCIIKNRHGKCAKDGKNILKDRLSNEFPILCTFGCRNVIYNCKTLYLADRKDEILKWGVDALWLYFTTENTNRVRQVLQEYDNRNTDYKRINPPPDHTRGLYYRNV